jgi:mono/diheme cytochrome c family protein
MRTFAPAILVLLLAASSAEAEENADGSIRAGRGIATMTCIACHTVSPDQTIKPIYAGLAPSFEDIANRPATSRESLLGFLASSHWNDPALAVKPAPMRLMSERQRTDVAAYILSLRRHK